MKPDEVSHPSTARGGAWLVDRSTLVCLIHIVSLRLETFAKPLCYAQNVDSMAYISIFSELPAWRRIFYRWRKLKNELTAWGGSTLPAACYGKARYSYMCIVSGYLQSIL